MTHTYTWRCTACPRPRITVETTEDNPPICPTCGKVMKTHDCCGVSGASPYATPGPFYLQPGEKHPAGWVWAKRYQEGYYESLSKTDLARCCEHWETLVERVIDILDGNADPVDFHDHREPKVLRKLSGHLEDYEKLKTKSENPWAKLYKGKLDTPDYLEPVFNAEFDTKPGGTVSFVAGSQHDPKRCGCGDCTRQKSSPEPMPEGDYEVEQFTTVEGRPVSLGRHVYYRPMGVAVQEQLNLPAEIVDAIPGTYEYHHPDAVHFIKGPEPDDPTVPVFLTTNLERRLDVTEHLVRELTERLYPVVQGDVETVVGGDCSPLGERVKRINGSLGRLLGGLDLP